MNLEQQFTPLHQKLILSKPIDNVETGQWMWAHSKIQATFFDFEDFKLDEDVDFAVVTTSPEGRWRAVRRNGNAPFCGVCQLGLRYTKL